MAASVVKSEAKFKEEKRIAATCEAQLQFEPRTKLAGFPHSAYFVRGSNFVSGCYLEMIFLFLRFRQ